MPDRPTDLLAVHADMTRLLAALPRGGRLEVRVRQVRAIVARLALAHGAVVAIGGDPVAAVERVVGLALAAGADWDQVVAAVSRARNPEHH